MVKIKNISSGILILADARLKLAPGETADVEVLSVQMQQCLDSGLLAQIETETDTKTKSKSTTRSSDSKKSASQVSQTDQTPAVDANSSGQSSSDKSQGQLIEASNAGS